MNSSGNSLLTEQLQNSARLSSNRLRTIRKNFARSTAPRSRPRTRRSAPSLQREPNYIEPNNFFIGLELKKIKKHFENFTNKKYIEPRFEKIGELSENGVIFKLTYTKAPYKTNAVLKIQYDMRGSAVTNLFYEYIVGKYCVNELRLVYPAFIETYALGYSRQPKVATESIDTIDDIELINISKKQIKDYIYDSCVNNKNYSLLIEYIPDASDMQKMLRIKTNYTHDLFFAHLFQIYYPLHHLAGKYTHGDLHTKNIMFFTPFGRGSYIDMHYFDGNNEIVFPTKYIAKMIDYGNSYFKMTPALIEMLRKKISHNPRMCGYDDFKFIDERKDLILFNGFREKSDKNKQYMSPEFADFNARLMKYKEYVAKIVPDGFYPNVESLYNAIKENLSKEDVKSRIQSYFDKYTKVGDMYIYGGTRPCEFVPITRERPATAGGRARH
jgi:hypothetical protein